MDRHSSFVDVLAEHVARDPDRVALVHSPDPAAPETEQRLAYGQLHERALRVAALLAEHGRVGERVLLQHSGGMHFAVGFLGAMYAGMIAVPAPSPEGNRRQNVRLAGIVRDATPAAVLTDAGAADAVTAWTAGAGVTGMAQLAVDGALPDALRTPTRVGGDTVVLLQYTSGSTREPKGVQIDHRNLLAHARTYDDFGRLQPDEAAGGWLPMYHDFGLIGQLLAPLYAGCRSVLMPPMTFLRRPHLWLHLIDRHGIKVSSAPNFAFDLCTQRITDEQVVGIDLSRWRIAVNGSEPIRARTLHAFRDRFAANGLRPQALVPGYGMAETTLVISGGRGDTAPVVLDVQAAALERHQVVAAAAADGKVSHLVSSGTVGIGLDVRIVDPQTGIELSEDRIGEIWVRGDGVSRGYWRRPQETAQAFDVPTADGEQGFLRTGDLGMRHGGQLYVTGRIKEMLTVAGRNLFPYDLEVDAAAAHTSLASGVGAAFGLDTGREESAVLVHECGNRHRDGDSPADIARRVQEVLVREHAVPVSVVLVRPGAVPRTTSGKIQRQLTRTQLVDGSLAPLHALLTPAVADHLAHARTAPPASGSTLATAPVAEEVRG